MPYNEALYARATLSTLHRTRMSTFDSVRTWVRTRGNLYDRLLHNAARVVNLPTNRGSKPSPVLIMFRETPGHNPRRSEAEARARLASGKELANSEHSR